MSIEAFEEIVRPTLTGIEAVVMLQKDSTGYVRSETIEQYKWFKAGLAQVPVTDLHIDHEVLNALCYLSQTKKHLMIHILRVKYSTSLLSG